MAAYLVSFREGGAQCGELITATDEATARQVWADIHSDGVIESVRRDRDAPCFFASL
jgi:hypothetical protein